MVKEDLQARGWRVAPGVLYGTDFLLYPPGSEHHEHSVFLVKLCQVLPKYLEVLASIRVATLIRKRLVLAVPDSDGVMYKEISRVY